MTKSLGILGRNSELKINGRKSGVLDAPADEMVRDAASSKFMENLGISALRLRKGLRCKDLGLEAAFKPLSLRFGLWPYGWELGLKAGIQGPKARIRV